jgi:hypothetical protein
MRLVGREVLDVSLSRWVQLYWQRNLVGGNSWKFREYPMLELSSLYQVDLYHQVGKEDPRWSQVGLVEGYWSGWYAWSPDLPGVTNSID